MTLLKNSHAVDQAALRLALRPDEAISAAKGCICGEPPISVALQPARLRRAPNWIQNAGSILQFRPVLSDD